MKTLAVAPTMMLAAAFLLLVACGRQENGGQDEAPPTSGIQGQVVIGPTCPAMREDTPCPDRPFQATIDVWNADRTEKAHTFTTDEQGRFHVPLPPGNYYIDPQPSAGRPPASVEPQTVTVVPGQFVEVAIEYDTGIR